MIDTLKHYISRSLPESGSFATNPNLRLKVDGEGNFLPFRGNTVIFDLSDEVKCRLSRLQDELYAAAGFMLAQRLNVSTFHMTLHDLANGTEDDPGLDGRIYAAEEDARRIMSGRGEFHALHMRATWMFNMVNTSIVLGLEPSDEESGIRLDGMYCALEDAVRLGYALTPHITLAYFLPGEYGEEQVQRLGSALRAVELDVTLRQDDLQLSMFTDMNHYREV